MLALAIRPLLRGTGRRSVNQAVTYALRYLSRQDFLVVSPRYTTEQIYFAYAHLHRLYKYSFATIVSIRAQ
jgi:hypothetical protein